MDGQNQLQPADPLDAPSRRRRGVDQTFDALALRALVDRRLAELVPAESVPPVKLHRSIRYSLLAPGKRLRPLLTMVSARSFGGDERLALDPACAIEMVHAASLIVDDFPCMDDAHERRGQPTNHRVYGLDTSTLAGFALLNRAFSVLAEARGLEDGMRIELVRLLSGSLGDCGGVIAGQEQDLEAPACELSVSYLETMVRHKTAALFVASVESGALIAGASAEARSAAREYAWNFGLCFQALDDLEDRPQASGQRLPDTDDGKLTFVSVLGVEAAWRAAEDYAWKAIAALEPVGLGDSQLAGLAHSLIGAERPYAAASGA